MVLRLPMRTAEVANPSTRGSARDRNHAFCKLEASGSRHSGSTHLEKFGHCHHQLGWIPPQRGSPLLWKRGLAGLEGQHFRYAGRPCGAAADMGFQAAAAWRLLCLRRHRHATA
eukprot:422349-Prymnesium_polylepis.3